jgi:hypothetical protein
VPEVVSIADGEEILWHKRALWLLLRALGGKVSITDEEWARVPERPELILDRSDGVMRWTAREPASPLAAELDGPEMPGQLPLPGTEPAT